MKNKKEELERYEGMLFDLENSNRLSNPGSQKAKDKKAKKLKDKIRRLKRDIQKEGLDIKNNRRVEMKISKAQLKKIIQEERQKIIAEAYVTDRKMDSFAMAERAGISPDTLHDIADEILEYFEYSEDMIDPEDYDALIRNLVYPLILRVQKRR